MYKRLIILSLIIVIALCGLTWLGYRAISMWIQGIEGTRISEFADVAERIRLDVEDKLDAFMEQEQNRPYTDYQYYTLPEDSFIYARQDVENFEYENADRRNALQEQGRQMALNDSFAQQTFELSPLAGDMEHGLASLSFQFDPDNNDLSTPNYKMRENQSQSLTDADFKYNTIVGNNLSNVRENVLPVLDKLEAGLSDDSHEKKISVSMASEMDRTETALTKDLEEQKENSFKGKTSQAKAGQDSRSANRTGSYNIPSFQNVDVQPQVQMQSRNSIITNEAQNRFSATEQASIINQDDGLVRQLAEIPDNETAQDEIAQVARSTDITAPSDMQQIPQRQAERGFGGGRGGFGGRMQSLQERDSNTQVDGGLERSSARDRSSEFGRTTSERSDANRQEQLGTQLGMIQQELSELNQADIVEVRIEPFVPIVVSAENGNDSIFGGQVFMVRKVAYEGRELIQGFQLNEEKLLEEVEESTSRLVREGMSYELGRRQNGDSAYTAILDFSGLGCLLLNLYEEDPGRLIMQISNLRTWYFSIVTVVFAAVILAVGSLWLNARAQLKLARKKDDFVSAVSHELRTPLTSIRMHAEMLENNWIKSEEKLGEYYKSMRAESERLSRLIENVLDFSRIQKGRKKYVFKLGDINKCVEDVVEMMKAYAAQKGFVIKTELNQCREIAFDSDAVTQIVVNLLDNAVKYARNSEDKTITVRTKSDEQFVLIEVEDHGPGIPHGQRKRIFQEFYRIGAESTRETAGSGLGLALVKKFAQAHNGFVEIINARPTGAIFRVILASGNSEAV